MDYPVDLQQKSLQLLPVFQRGSDYRAPFWSTVRGCKEHERRGKLALPGRESISMPQLIWTSTRSTGRQGNRAMERRESSEPGGSIWAPPFHSNGGQSKKSPKGLVQSAPESRLTRLRPILHQLKCGPPKSTYQKPYSPAPSGSPWSPAAPQSPRTPCCEPGASVGHPPFTPMGCNHRTHSKGVQSAPQSRLTRLKCGAPKKHLSEATESCSHWFPRVPPQAAPPNPCAHLAAQFPGGVDAQSPGHGVSLGQRQQQVVGDAAGPRRAPGGGGPGSRGGGQGLRAAAGRAGRAQVVLGTRTLGQARTLGAQGRGLVRVQQQPLPRSSPAGLEQQNRGPRLRGVAHGRTQGTDPHPKAGRDGPRFVGVPGSVEKKGVLACTAPG